MEKFLKISVDTEEIEVLNKAIDWYKVTSKNLNYGEFVDLCKKIKKTIEINSKKQLLMFVTEFEIIFLIRLIDWYQLCCGFMDYGAHIEDCETLKNKILKGI